MAGVCDVVAIRREATQKAGNIRFFDLQPMGSCGLCVIERTQLKHDRRFRGQDGQALGPYFFFLGVSTEADWPLVKMVGAATGSFFFLGFRISRLLRFCPLAMMSSCTNPVPLMRSVKNERPRYPEKVRGQYGARGLIRQRTAASFVSTASASWNSTAASVAISPEP